MLDVVSQNRLAQTKEQPELSSSASIKQQIPGLFYPTIANELFCGLIFYQRRLLFQKTAFKWKGVSITPILSNAVVQPQPLGRFKQKCQVSFLFPQ